MGAGQDARQGNVIKVKGSLFVYRL